MQIPFRDWKIVKWAGASFIEAAADPLFDEVYIGSRPVATPSAALDGLPGRIDLHG